VDDERVHLVEGPGIEKKLDALARGQLSGFVLLGDALGAAPLARFLVAPP
jgi:hypothetical protein